MLPQALVTFTLLASGAFSLRQRRPKQNASSGMASARKIDVISFAGAKVSRNKFPPDYCLDGYRVETENFVDGGSNPKDIVTWLLIFHKHPSMKVLRLGDGGEAKVMPCNWERNRDPEARRVSPSRELHDVDVYVNRSLEFGGKVGVVADVALRYIYELDPVDQVSEKGWGLVFTALVGDNEVSHLMQNPDTLECILTFEGTDKNSEWGENLNTGSGNFCGFRGIHSGFRNVLREMYHSPQWQEGIRPQLGFCASLTVTGHSLGASMATLLVGCAQSKRDGDADYDLLKWDWESPRKLEYLKPGQKSVSLAAHRIESARKINLISFGGAKVSASSFPPDYCFDGYRVVTENFVEGRKNPKDIVTWLMIWYKHPTMKVLRLGEEGENKEMPCGWNRNKDQEARNVDPIWEIHESEVYINRSLSAGGEVAVAADVGLRWSYEVNPAKQIAKQGWGLVFTALIGNAEVSHLIQNPDTLQCLLTFEGADQASEWLENINVGRADFCGFRGIHKGFRNVLRTMYHSPQWQDGIRPQLGYCSGLTVTGHSLGGSMATLLVGCAQSGRNGDKDYDLLKWEWQKPKKLGYK